MDMQFIAVRRSCRLKLYVRNMPIEGKNAVSMASIMRLLFDHWDHDQMVFCVENESFGEINFLRYGDVTWLSCYNSYNSHLSDFENK